MKLFILLSFLFLSESLFANMYFSTEYQEATKPPVITKHHIFLNKRYPINYTKMAYALTLTKIESDRGTLETETFIIDKKGKREFSAGGIANFFIGKPIKLEQFSRSGKREFILKIIPEKIVP